MHAIGLLNFCSFKLPERKAVLGQNAAVRYSSYFGGTADQFQPSNTHSPIVWPAIEPKKIPEYFSIEKIQFLLSHIEAGICLIKNGQYEQATAHFCNQDAAEHAGFDIRVSPIPVKQIPKKLLSRRALSLFKRNYYQGMERAFYFSNHSYFVRGRIGVAIPKFEIQPTPKQRGIADQLKEQAAYGALEEWLHAAQDVLGVPLSQKTRALTQKMGLSGRVIRAAYVGQIAYFIAAKQFEENNWGFINFPQWIALVQKACGFPLGRKAALYTEEITFDKLIVEMDIGHFFKENGLPLKQGIRCFHKRHWFIDFNAKP
jgi:hypothetical protein